MDRLAVPEIEAMPIDSYPLVLAADQVHLNTPNFLVIKGMMGKRRRIEIGTQLTIDARQEIEIEGGGDAVGIVIGGIEYLRVFFQIDTNQ